MTGRPIRRRAGRRKLSEFEEAWNAAVEIDILRERIKQERGIDGRLAAGRRNSYEDRLRVLNNILTSARNVRAIEWQRAAIEKARRLLGQNRTINKRRVAEAVRQKVGVAVTDLTVERFLRKVGLLKSANRRIAPK